MKRGSAFGLTLLLIVAVPVLSQALPTIFSFNYFQQVPTTGRPQGFEDLPKLSNLLSFFSLAKTFDYEKFALGDATTGEKILLFASVRSIEKQGDGTYVAFATTSSWIRDMGFDDSPIEITSKKRIFFDEDAMQSALLFLTYTGTGKATNDGGKTWITVPVFNCAGCVTIGDAGQAEVLSW